MYEKWEKPDDKGKAFGDLMTDLSKAFNYLDHKLLIEKLFAYGFMLLTLNLFTITSLEGSKGQKLNQYIVNGSKLLLEFHNVRSWDSYCLTNF